MAEKPAETLEKARTHRLTRLREAGLAEGVAESRIAAAELSLAGAYALADAIDAIRRAASPP
jgi:hypothetical protein